MAFKLKGGKNPIQNNHPSSFTQKELSPTELASRNEVKKGDKGRTGSEMILDARGEGISNSERKAILKGRNTTSDGTTYEPSVWGNLSNALESYGTEGGDDIFSEAKDEGDWSAKHAGNQYWKDITEEGDSNKLDGATTGFIDQEQLEALDARIRYEDGYEGSQPGGSGEWKRRQEGNKATIENDVFNNYGTNESAEKDFYDKDYNSQTNDEMDLYNQSVKANEEWSPETAAIRHQQFVPEKNIAGMPNDGGEGRLTAGDKNEFYDASFPTERPDIYTTDKFTNSGSRFAGSGAQALINQAEEARAGEAARGGGEQKSFADEIQRRTTIGEGTQAITDENARLTAEELAIQQSLSRGKLKRRLKDTGGENLTLTENAAMQKTSGFKMKGNYPKRI